jgi:nitrogen fixation/metabolism regulation signal transduction histidine kinase
MGLTPEDAGTFVERVLATVVVGVAVEMHNRDVEAANRAAKK